MADIATEVYFLRNSTFSFQYEDPGSVLFICDKSAGSIGARRGEAKFDRLARTLINPFFLAHLFIDEIDLFRFAVRVEMNFDGACTFRARFETCGIVGKGQSRPGILELRSFTTLPRSSILTICHSP